MHRRAFLKAGLVVSGSLIAPATIPLKAVARSSIAQVGALDGLAGADAAPGICQGNDSCVTIHPGIFAANIQHLKEDIGPEIKLCIVMKSDAYAHGVDNLMPEALQAEPAYIGMTGNHDIRKAVNYMKAVGKQVSILRIAPATAYEAAEAIDNHWPVEETVGCLEQVKRLSAMALWSETLQGRQAPIPVHINVDTGMGRMGFVSIDDIKAAIDMPGIKVRGLMTHYANAYDLDHGEALTKAAFDKFEAVKAQLDLPDDVIVHTANSGAALCFPWARCDMVRTGGALYGDIPGEMNPDERYRQVMASFRSRVVWMAEAPPNTPVGYESVYRTPKDRPSTLATVKIGYNNGLPSWAYKKHTQVLIRGRRFPVVGKTSMNMVVVDVTNQNPTDKVRLGDEVVIFGRQGDEEIRWDALEESLGVATTEMSLTIGKSNPRILVRGDD